MVQFEPKIEWISECHPMFNIDSLATWTNEKKELIFVTSKNNNDVMIMDRKDGRELARFGNTGNQLGEFKRPNGITIIDNLIIVLERENHRIQIFGLPKLDLIGTFGNDILVNPYGICSLRLIDINNIARYSLFVTDDQKKTVFNFIIGMKNNKLMFVKYYPLIENNKPVRLERIESLCPDIKYNRLLVADEISKNIKIYNLQGEYIETIGDNIFIGEPEGMALVKTDPNNGIYITTDQLQNDNKFHLWNRQDLKYLGYFSNKNIQNTDGICVSQQDYNCGSFYAVHNDCAIARINLKDILEGLVEKKHKRSGYGVTYNKINTNSLISAGLLVLTALFVIR